VPYLNLDPNFSSHPKAMRLNGRLGANTHLLMINLWCFAAKFHPRDGDLSIYSIAEIESFAAWAGDKQCFYNACVEVGFIDVKKDGKSVTLHDWKDHQGHLEALKVRAQKAAKARWNKIQKVRTKGQVTTPQKDKCNATSTAKKQQAMLDECSFPSSPSSPSNPSTKKSRQPKRLADYSSDVQKLTQFLKSLILKNKSDRKLEATWNTSTAAKIDLMIRKDNRKPARIKEVIEWCQSDIEPRGSGNFCWAPNILSGAKLRKQFDRLEEDMERSRETKEDSSRGW